MCQVDRSEARDVWSPHLRVEEQKLALAQPLDERDERICVENNGGFGMIGTPVTPVPDPPRPE